MKKVILVFALILFGNIINAQNITMAKAFYKKAQKEYENKNYREVIKLLEQTVADLNGQTNPDIIYLEAKSRLAYDTNYKNAKILFNQFIHEADKNDGRIEEVSSILVDFETSKNYYSNGQIKTHELISPSDGNKYVYHYFKSGYLIKLETYDKDRDFKLSRIIYFKGDVKESRDIIREEWYYENGEIEHVDYYLQNVARIKIWGNGEHIHVYDKTGKFIQRYGLKEHNLLDGNFYSFKSFDNWDTYNPYFMTSNLISSATVLAIHNNLSIEPIDMHKNLIFGPVKKLKVPVYYADEEHYIYYFDLDGVPTSKEFYNKRGKLKKSYTFNKYDSSWSEL